MTDGIATAPAPAAPTTPTSPAAPSSPSPSSAGGPPAASPSTPSSAPQGGGGASPATAAADVPADESARGPDGRFTKRPSLPGVHTDRDIKPIQTRADRRAQRQAAELAKAKGDAGGKTGPEAVAPPPGSPASQEGQSAPQPGQGAEGAANAPKFSFAGRAWDSPQQAEQSFRTLQGLHRSLNERLNVATQMNRDNEYSAREWKRVAEQAQAEVESLRGGKPPGQPGASQGAQPSQFSGDAVQPLDRIPESADDILAGVDLGLVAEIAEERGPLAATHLLLTEALNRMLPAFRAEIDRAREPFAQYSEAAQVTHQAQSLIEDLGSWTKQLPDGTQTPELLYPELSDATALNKIAALWEKLGMSPEVMLSPQGLMTAILHYRNMMSIYHPESAAPSSAIPAAPGATTPSSGATAAAAAVTARLTGQAPGDALSGPSGVAVRPGHPESDADRIRREFREAPGLHKDLGFVTKPGKTFAIA